MVSTTAPNSGPCSGVRVPSPTPMRTFIPWSLPLRATDRQGGSGPLRPAWPGNAVPARTVSACQLRAKPTIDDRDQHEHRRHVGQQPQDDDRHHREEAEHEAEAHGGAAGRRRRPGRPHEVHGRLHEGFFGMFGGEPQQKSCVLSFDFGPIGPWPNDRTLGRATHPVTVPGPMEPTVVPMTSVPSGRDMLRDRSVATFLLAAGAASTATMLQAAALGKHLFDITDSALALGLLGLVEFLPGAAAAPAHRLGRRPLRPSSGRGGGVRRRGGHVRAALRLRGDRPDVGRPDLRRRRSSSARRVPSPRRRSARCRR